jgi:ATP-dependent DNA helicase RecG
VDTPDVPVISGGVDYYKITFPLVKVTEKDTIKDTINSLSDNERTVFEEMQMRPKVTANELSEILNINLRNTKKIIEKLKEKGLVKRIGSRKAGHWEVVSR